MGRIALKQSMMGNVDLPACAKMNKDVFGNQSKFSKNWIAGPTHHVRRQQVPGYTGHIRGMVNRDSMSKSYARVTATLFAKKHPITVDNTPRGRFSSTQRDEYRLSNNRRFADNKESVPRKDYDDFSKYINEAHQSRKELLTGGIEVAAQTARPSRTTMKHHPPTLDILASKTTSQNFFKTTKRGFSIDHGGFSGSQTTTSVKPRILESKVAENKDFYNLSDGFKRIFADDKKDRKLIVPVVGYGGHRRGDRSQNYFGKSFRDTTIQSKCLERNFRSNSLAQ